MSVININRISKSYGKTTVVDNFSLNIEKGHICGLIGPNGAGKTTIMKILAGLIFQSEGELSFFDSGDLDSHRSRMSFMIEAPIVDPQMNAYDNLAYLSFVRGYPDIRRIGEVLDLVGLNNTGKKKCEKYSLGMRQRLGIALALLTKPEVLVLDEPVNGLDPEGIVEIRHILKRLSEEHSVTILISSHMLSELSELCTDFSIISHGRLIENISAPELMFKCRSHISLKTTDINRTSALLENKLSIHDYKVLHGEEIKIPGHLDQIEKISKAITDNGLVITRICEEGKNLEDYYLEKAGGSND
ncbi:MAG: ATP-binding cassette domain-containing protein [Oscillospiraceae bacterium]|nr:ATP-binding cassette domain-containing protein [Oscillospiraceae bacterium]